MTQPVPVTPQPGGRRWYDAPYRAGVWVVSPITGDDGRPSWWKLMGLAVLVTYWFERPLPESVAVVLLFCAFGVKVALALVNAGAAKLSPAGLLGAALGPRTPQDAPQSRANAPGSDAPPDPVSRPSQPATVPATGQEEG